MTDNHPFFFYHLQSFVFVNDCQRALILEKHGMLDAKSISTNFVVSALISADVSLSQVANIRGKTTGSDVSSHLKNWMDLQLTIDISVLLIDLKLEKKYWISVF